VAYIVARIFLVFPVLPAEAYMNVEECQFWPIDNNHVIGKEIEVD
jgi:hypothetical protein